MLAGELSLRTVAINDFDDQLGLRCASHQTTRPSKIFKTAQSHRKTCASHRKPVKASARLQPQDCPSYRKTVRAIARLFKATARPLKTSKSECRYRCLEYLSLGMGFSCHVVDVRFHVHCSRVGRGRAVALGRWWDWVDPQSRGEFTWRLSGQPAASSWTLQDPLDGTGRTYVVYDAQKARLYPTHLPSMGRELLCCFNICIKSFAPNSSCASDCDQQVPSAL